MNPFYFPCTITGIKLSLFFIHLFVLLSEKALLLVNSKSDGGGAPAAAGGGGYAYGNHPTVPSFSPKSSSSLSYPLFTDVWTPTKTQHDPEQEKNDYDDMNIDTPFVQPLSSSSSMVTHNTHPNHTHDMKVSSSLSSSQTCDKHHLDSRHAGRTIIPNHGGSQHHDQDHNLYISSIHSNSHHQHLLGIHNNQQEKQEQEEEQQLTVTLTECVMNPACHYRNTPQVIFDTSYKSNRQEEQKYYCNPYHQRRHDEDKDDDDDEDDDDDGHSSVLSTHSIRMKMNQVTQLHTSTSTAGYSRSRNKPRYWNSIISSTNHQTAMMRCGSSLSTYTHAPVISTTTTTTTTTTTNLFHFKSFFQLRGGATGTSSPSSSSSSSSLGSEYTKQLLVAALVTLLYEAVLGHFLEFLKIVMQTAPPGTTYKQVISTITAQKGILGIWDGFIPWGIFQALAKGSVFGFAHALAMSWIQSSSYFPFPISSSLFQQTVAGGIAGGFQGYILSPTLLLKTRVMTHSIFRQPMSLWQTTWISLQMGLDIVHSEGVGVLMKGSNIFAFKRVLDWSTRFFFSDWMEQLLLVYKQQAKLSSTDSFLASLLGGALSTLVTLPLDVIVAKTQDAKKAGVHVSPWELFIKDYKLGGWMGVYDANMRGFEARLAHVSLTTVVMKSGTRWMYQFLFGKK